MHSEVDYRLFSIVIGSLIASGEKSAVKYIDSKTVMRATWRFKPKANSRIKEIVVTYGAPNYREREFIKRCKKAHDDLSIREIQYRPFPKKKAK